MLKTACDVYETLTDVRKVRVQVSLLEEGHDGPQDSDVDLFLEAKDLSPRARDMLVAGITILLKPPAERKKGETDVDEA